MTLILRDVTSVLLAGDMARVKRASYVYSVLTFSGSQFLGTPAPDLSLLLASVDMCVCACPCVHTQK